MDSNFLVQRFMQMALTLSKTETQPWVVSDKIQKFIYENLQLNTFLLSIFNAASKLTEANTNQYFENLQKDTKGDWHTQEILKTLTQENPSNISRGTALCLKVMLDLKVQFSRLNNELLELRKPIEKLDFPEDEFLELINPFLITWIQYHTTPEQKQKILFPLMYPAAIRGITTILHAYRLSLMPGADRKAIQICFQYEGDIAGIEQMKQHYFKQDKSTRKKLQIATELEDRFFNHNNAKLLQQLTNNPSAIPQILNQDTLNTLIDSAADLRKKQIKNTIEGFLKTTYEKLEDQVQHPPTLLNKRF